jgi:hypothetical protein
MPVVLPPRLGGTSRVARSRSGAFPIPQDLLQQHRQMLTLGRVMTAHTQIEQQILLIAPSLLSNRR